MTTPASSIAVRATNLGKRYDLSSVRGRGSVYGNFGRLLGRGDGLPAKESTVWALREASFEVRAGEVLGVIGRNGSGKSTLMKVLARVTAPTEGEAEIRGRVAALLQIGAGFHPELSGRDNIVLSGTIMGLKPREIAAAADQIIEFAEIGRYIDTPVKFYSSGMYVRLAFSVSSHLGAEIMLLDEILSVGDLGFQAKCRERIRELVRGGRAVIFVSHTMDAVRNLCDSAMVLDGGRVRFAGDTSGAIEFYEREVLHMTRRQAEAVQSM
ncbi:MAG: ABC transporter ATP-binding protein [Candidatus Limnocylindrales bacterium]